MELIGQESYYTIPNFVQPYTQQPLILYQLKTVPILIISKNTKAYSYTELQDKETLYGIKFRNIHQHMTTRVSYLQKNRV